MANIEFFRYFILPTNQTKWIEITSDISKGFNITKTIENQPVTFDFEVNSPNNLENKLYIKEGFKVCITNYYLSECIAYGIIANSNPEIPTYNYDDNTSIIIYSISCIEEDINGIDIIDRFNYNNDLLFSDILNDILVFPYLSDFYNTSIKYKLNFDDFYVNGISFEKLTLSQAIGSLCDQTSVRNQLSYNISPDNINTLKISRYLEFFSNSGINFNSSSPFYGGITDSVVKNGLEAKANQTYEFYLNGLDYKITPNIEVITNMISLSGNIYANSGDILERCEIPATVRKLDYKLDIIAADIFCVGTLISTSCLIGSTNINIKISSLATTNIKANDTVLIKPKNSNLQQVNKSDFRTITNISTSLGITTITLNSILSFTPTLGDTFEIVGNHKIYEENQEDIPTTGVIKRISREQAGEIKFLKLSEPHEGQTIIVYASKLISDSLKLRNYESIKQFGLRYKEIKLPDDLILTNEQFNYLGNQLLIDKPNFELKVNLISSEIQKIASILSINISNYCQENLFLIENILSESNSIDKYLKPICSQDLTFSTLNKNQEEIINNFKRSLKKSTKTTFDKNLFLQTENISIQDIIEWSKVGALKPEFSSFEFDGNNALILHWGAYPNAIAFYIELSLYNNFSSILTSVIIDNGNQLLGAIIGDFIENNNNFYARIKAKSNNNIISEWSNTLEIIKITQRDLVTDSNTLLYYDLQDNSSSINDKTANNKDSTIIGTANWQSGIITNDNYSLKLNGSSNTATSNFAPAVIEFTARIAFRFDTGDKSSKSTHILISRYDTLTGISTTTGADFIGEYEPSSNKLLFTIYQANAVYRTFEAIYNLLENTNYYIEFAFKLNHFGTNLFEIRVNGINQTTTLNSQNISNLSSIQNSNIPLMVAAYRASSGTYYRGQFRALRVAFDNRFRTESESLTDYNNLFG